MSEGSQGGLPIRGDAMKAVVFKAPYKLAVENVDDPTIEHH